MALPVPPSDAGELEPLLKPLLAVGPGGVGNREAAVAWQQVAQSDASQLPVLLAALDQAGPLAANWIRTAIDAIAERQLQRGGKLPTAELERFLAETRHDPRARRLAYEWLVRVDPTAPDRIIPTMLNDPSVEMRRDAVERLIEQGTRLAETQKDQAAAVYKQALSASRDLDQIRLLAERLRRLGQQVDLPRHFGFILQWKTVGPFDNTGEKGFAVVYPPEKGIDLSAACPGKHGSVKWGDSISKDDYGHIDLNKALGEEKEVVGYAASEFVAEKPQDVEFRLASFNAVKLWLNGKLIDEHDVYHGGSQMDQYVSRTTLSPGRNTILVKVCQNAQTQDWAKVWGFQLRVCDPMGGAVLSADRKNEPEKKP
jgi:hypothetical protein